MADGVYVGVGSNIGDRALNCRGGVIALCADRRVALSALSSLYTTSPVSALPQDDFLNCAMRITWREGPYELLALLLSIEQAKGRTRLLPDAPRTLDLDILLFGGQIVESPTLVVPHPRLHLRKFAIVPCLEIDAELVHPRFGRKLSSFLADVDESQRIGTYRGPGGQTGSEWRDAVVDEVRRISGHEGD